MVSVVARVMAPFTLYVGMLFALTLFLAGHNEPGGGFIAGAMLGSVFALLYLVFGREWVESRYRVDFRAVAGLGLLVAVFFAFLPLALGEPALTSFVVDLTLPLLGEVKVATAVGFDFGVLLAVAGAILAILTRGAESHE